MKRKIFLITFLFAILLSGFFSIKASAVDLKQQATVQLNAGAKKVWATDPQDPRVVTARMVNSFLALMTSIFIVLMIMASFWFITARGRSERVEKASKTMRGAIIGLIIVAAAYSITYFVSKNLQKSVGVRGGSVTNVSP